MKKSLFGLPWSKIVRGIKRLRTVVEAPAWLAMLKADDERLRRLGAAWKEIFLPQPTVEVPKMKIPDSESQARCRELFGPDFFGLKEAVGLYGYAFSEKEIEERKAVRILARDGTLLSEEQSWELIRLCREKASGQFVCCVGVPHSTCDVFAAHPEVFHPDHRKHAWFTDSDQRTRWSDKKIPDFWFLLRKDVVPQSWDKSSKAQEDWLPTAHSHECFAEPQHIIYGDVLCEKATQGKLRLYCGERWARTLARAADGDLVRMGRGPYGLDVGGWSGGPRWSGGVPSLWTSEP